MKKFLLLLLPLLVVGCGTTSKKIVERPPLAADAPVQVFWTVPNLKYERICEIEAKGNNSLGGMYQKKEDFEAMFKDEARKCGADAVIFQSLSGYKQGSATATAVGIKLTGQAAGLVSEDKIKAFSIAIQTHDVANVREILINVPKNKAERAPSDDELVNQGLYIALLDGIKCDPKVVELLETEYGARISKFEQVKMYSIEKPDSNTPLCRDVIAQSLPQMKDVTPAVIKLNNYYVSLLKYRTDKDFDKKVKAYNQALVVAAKLIAESCKKSTTSATCAVKAGYVDLAHKSKVNGSPALKKNANDILKTLRI